MFLLLGDVTEDGLQVSHPFVHWSDRSVIVFSGAVSKDMLLKLTCLRRILVISNFSLKKLSMFICEVLLLADVRLVSLE